MSAIRLVEPVVRICAIITGDDAARRWALQRLSDRWGPPLRVADPVPFHAGGFYQPTMGPGLDKTLVALSGFQDPAGLADWKLQSNAWESEYAARGPHPFQRPINLDSGYISQAKLVLATVKDRDHRIYLRDGIFAEVTLNYVGKSWRAHRWSYPSYRVEAVAEFASRCRETLREHLKATGQFRHARG